MFFLFFFVTITEPSGAHVGDESSGADVRESNADQGKTSGTHGSTASGSQGRGLSVTSVLAPFARVASV